MLSVQFVLTLARLWNILAILLLSAFINLITQLPWSDWQTKTPSLKTFAILGTFFFLVSGVLSQVLFERSSAFLVAAAGDIRAAAKLVDKDNARILRLESTATILLGAFGVIGWIAFRVC